MDELTPHEREILREALALEEREPPSPWRRAAFVTAGGLIAAGWDEGENVLLVSHSGYGVVTPSGSKLLRDRDAGRASQALSPDGLSFDVPEQGRRVPVFGIGGGDGAHVTADGWTVQVIHPLWPRPRVLLRRPLGPGAAERSAFEGATRLALAGLDEHDWIRTGFSPSGARLMIVSASGCLVLAR